MATQTSAQKTEELLAALDELHKQGFIQEDEYQKQRATLAANVEKAQALKVFNQFDTDASGTIDANELQELVFALGEIMDAAEVKQLLESLDHDKDGVINFDEFFVWWSDTSRAKGDSKAGILKLKLQSKAYVRTAKKGAQGLSSSTKKVKTDGSAKADNALRFNAEVVVGAYEKETESVKVSFDSTEGVADNFRKVNEFDDGSTSVVVTFDLKEGAPEDGLTFFNSLLEGAIGEIPITAAKVVKWEDASGAKKVSLRATLDPEIASMGSGIVETAGVEIFDVSLKGDLKNAAFKLLLNVAVSRNLIELAHEMGILKDQVMFKAASMFERSSIKVHLRSPQDLSNPLIAQGLAILQTPENNPLQPKIKEILESEEMFGQAYKLFMATTSNLTEITAVTGNSLFSAKIHIPDLFKAITVELEEAGDGSKLEEAGEGSKLEESSDEPVFEITSSD